ncbi:hypothetical protein T440DRAFT_470732 [Plenodomus tracheiphilus IPT5]|uniref:Gag1-like clamp domain-containing protein n=1 Tax=Plenodomus tracheiphilus IPT5 TaxID=1408161 RepID=A0A6A7AXX9_9PLEO|nr:hypothetical protein T440DRAFT_470732 [Plenodomus tracheiphilus IPT5]
MESNQSAARQAKRFLEERIRTDWAYPDLPPPWSASDEEVRDAHDFRERYYGESDSGDSSASDEGNGPYKFDSPDSIGHAVAHTQDARMRRRRERLGHEMEENEGLRIWVQRRDAWTGAASVRKYCGRKAGLSDSPIARNSSEEHAVPTGFISQSTDSAIPDMADVVPVAPRLLDANPIRASITPRAYSDIFQKIVVSARTPSVPINLADMTQALVHGWKETDEWPPRVGALDPLAGKKRGITGTALSPQHGRFINRHPHLEKSVDSVKRILHLNGHHNPETPEGEKEG